MTPTSTGTPAAGTSTAEVRTRYRRRGAAAGVAVAVVLVAAFAVLCTRPEGDPSLMTTTNGVVRGDAGHGVRRFEGIPYAAPPVEELRWRLPQPVAGWNGIRDATDPPSRCIQADARGMPDPASSEDCLYLNVTAPRSSSQPLPVMVWFHGGAFSSGAGSDYDPRRMAIQGKVAVVTVNSRLGVFGYFGHPSLTDSGTYGLADQQAALRWVRDNAGAFGGDPNRVTLFGNSSGAANICAHLASPESTGLFDRAIVQSGSCRQHWRRNVMFPGAGPISYWSTLQTAQNAGRTAASTLGCSGSDTLRCLRQKSPADLLAVNGRFLTMTNGTPLLPDDPIELIRTGDLNRVPVLQGNTRDEHRLFARLFEIDESAGAATYRRLLAGAFPGQVRPIIRRYPLGSGGAESARFEVELAWAAVATDSSWICPTLQTTTELSHHVPTYSYEFADAHPPADPLFPPGFPTGAPHGSEVPYLFDVGAQQDWSRSQRALSDRMVNYWTTFAHDGRPASPDVWPASSGDRPAALQLQPGGDQVIQTGITHRCAFWSARSSPPLSH